MKKENLRESIKKCLHKMERECDLVVRECDLVVREYDLVAGE